MSRRNHKDMRVGKELQEILEHCHMGPVRGHYGADITARKIFESGFYWPTIFKDKECCRENVPYDLMMLVEDSNISSRNQCP
ncbi:hypothetical protein Tco_1232805 [Tanacetum coccineum]